MVGRLSKGGVFPERDCGRSLAVRVPVPLGLANRSGRAWEDKVFHRCETAGGADVHVWGM